MKKSFYLLLTVFVLFTLFFADQKAIAAGPVQIKVVGFAPKNHPLVPPIFEYIKMLNNGLKGEVQAKYVGGPEAIPASEQFEAVKNNIVQMVLLPAAYYIAALPEGATRVLIRHENAMELRKSPYHDFLVKKHEEVGVRYLATGLWNQFYTWTIKPVKSLQDMKGLKMRSFFVYDRFQQALGMTPVNIAVPEIYTALERGVVDGMMYPYIGPREQGFTKFLKYIVDHPFYKNDINILLNLATWKKFSKSTQERFLEITAKEYDPYITDHAEKTVQAEMALLEKEGVKRFQLPPEEAKKYEATAYRVKWEEIGEKIPAETLAKLKKLTGN